MFRFIFRSDANCFSIIMESEGASMFATCPLPFVTYQIHAAQHYYQIACSCRIHNCFALFSCFFFSKKKKWGKNQLHSFIRVCSFLLLALAVIDLPTLWPPNWTGEFLCFLFFFCNFLLWAILDCIVPISTNNHHFMYVVYSTIHLIYAVQLPICCMYAAFIPFDL